MKLAPKYILAVCTLLPDCALFAQTTPQATTHLEGAFEVVISRRGNPIHEPYAIAGKLAIDVDATGAFTGVVSAGLDQNGNPLPAVRFEGPTLTPASDGPGSYNVYGQISGRSFVIAIELDADNNKYVYGTGVSKQDFREVANGDVSFLRAAGGTAVGPDGGDQGDWEVVGIDKTTTKSGFTTMTCTTVSVFGYVVYMNCTTVTNFNGASAK